MTSVYNQIMGSICMNSHDTWLMREYLRLMDLEADMVARLRGRHPMQQTFATIQPPPPMANSSFPPPVGYAVPPNCMGTSVELPDACATRPYSSERAAVGVSESSGHVPGSTPRVTPRGRPRPRRGRKIEDHQTSHPSQNDPGGSSVNSQGT